MTTCAFSPDLLMLSALDRELSGQPSTEADQLGPWALAVADYLRDCGTEYPLDADWILATASRALREMMCSGSWQFLLEDALIRPVAFARALQIMLQGQVAPALSLARQ